MSKTLYSVFSFLCQWHRLSCWKLVLHCPPFCPLSIQYISVCSHFLCGSWICYTCGNSRSDSDRNTMYLLLPADLWLSSSTSSYTPAWVQLPPLWQPCQPPQSAVGWQTWCQFQCLVSHDPVIPTYFDLWQNDSKIFYFSERINSIFAAELLTGKWL